MKTKTKAQRTPGKWSYRSNFCELPGFVIGAQDTASGLKYADSVEAVALHVAQVESEANAAFIVKACNIHDELAEALRNVQNYFDALANMQPEKNRGSDFTRIREVVQDAIAKASQ